MEKHSERITKIKPLINKYNCEEINVPSEKDDLKKMERNNLTIARSFLYAKKNLLFRRFQERFHVVDFTLLFFVPADPR